MYTFEYIFYPDYTKVEDALTYYDGVLCAFVFALINNGQMIEQFLNVIEDNNTIILNCLIPEKDSLESKYYNIYCTQYLDKLNKVSLKLPVYKMISKTLGNSDCCSCSESSYYVLYTRSGADYRPIICGDCDLPVPLYKFPNFEGEFEYYPIRTWENSAQACDSLFMNTDVGEKYGYKQISDVNSQLSIKGMEICSKMKMVTGKPFYYFLKKYYSKQKDECPKCKKPWKLNETLHDYYTHKCDKCLLISDNTK